MRRGVCVRVFLCDVTEVARFCVVVIVMVIVSGGCRRHRLQNDAEILKDKDLRSACTARAYVCAWARGGIFFSNSLSCP